MTPERNTITIGDALEYLEALPAGGVQLFLFSPPYNLGNTTGGFAAEKVGHYADSARMHQRGGGGKWTPKSSGSWLGNRPAIADGYEDTTDTLPHVEYVAWQHAILHACWRALPDHGAIFYNHKPRIMNGNLIEPRDYVPRDIPLHQRIIWARAGGINFSPSFYLPTYEEILVLAKSKFRLASRSASGIGDVWSIAQESNTWHPAPFPLVLAERVMETVRPALVCDPFMGSGTTAKAAVRYGIDWLGCEKSATYAARAMREIETTQPRELAMMADQEVLF